MFFFFYNAGTPYSDPNARLLKLIEAFQERAPWYVAKRVLQRHQVPIGHGWENTIEAATGYKGSADVDGLVTAYLDHICSGEKSVRFYDLGTANVDSLRLQYQNFKNAPFLPLPLSGHQLQKAQLCDPTLVYVHQTPTGIAAIYSSVRKKDERQRLSVQSLPKAAQQAIGDFEEIIGIHSRKVQAYDVVWVPNNGKIIEVRADFLGNETQETVTNAHQKIYADVHVKSGSKALIAPVDLFPAIKPIYDNSNEGIVIELAFATSTGSTKHEKMRDKDACLRKEVYHVNGKAALAADIEPYRIGVRWVLTDQHGEFSSPELFLDGRATMAASTSPGLFSATIRKCSDSLEYSEIKQKLESYL